MPRLIDADALTKAHCEGCAADIQEMCKTDPVCASMMWVVEAPTVDAVEVVHGRWILTANDDVPNYKWSVDAECSECHEKVKIYEMYISGFPFERAREIVLRESKQKTSNYCPNCGAKMDKEN